MQSQTPPDFPTFNPMYFATFGIVMLLFLGFAILLNWRIATKAGYPGIMSLLVLIPVVNFCVIIYFAFAEWPIETEVRALRNAKQPY